jgi:hypothetical protein
MGESKQAGTQNTYEERLALDYQWTNEQIKLLTDIRFRLLQWCQRRCNDASAGRSKNTSMSGKRPQRGGPFRPVSDLVEMIRRRIGTGTV